VYVLSTRRIPLMIILFEVARAVSILAFLLYGITCVASSHMVAEFERYGLARMRVLTGSLEIAGALGLLAGYFVPWMTVLAAGGLTLLMLLGIVTRIRIRDPLVAMLPAGFFLALNLFVAIRANG
jgi:hypothetical protein